MLTLPRCGRHLTLAATCVAALLAVQAPAHAEIPQDVEAMIREAARIGNATTVAAVVEVAKSLNPEQAEEIGKFGEPFMAQATNPVPPPPPVPPEIDPEVEAMIREAAKTGNADTLAAVLLVAKSTTPQKVAAIDKLGQTLLAQAPRPAITPPVEAMIREAGRIGDATTLNSVVKVAKSNDPDDSRAIDQLGASLMGDIKAKAAADAARKREAEIARLASLGAFDGWSGQGEAGFSLTTGNTDQVGLLVGLKLNKEGLKTRHKFAASLDYQETDKIKTRERYLANYGFSYLLNDSLYASATLGWEQDRFAGFAHRFTESIGIGYRFSDWKGMTLDVDGGPAMRQTRLINGFSSNEYGARGSITYRWTIRDGYVFSEDGSIVVSDSNTTFISTSALTAKLTSFISGRISFNIQSESDPLLGLESTETATRASIVYSF